MRILFLLMYKQDAYKTLTKEQDRFWKRIFIIDDDSDVTISFKTVIEESNDTADVNKTIVQESYRKNSH